jgi:hypothetical protein
MGKSRNGAVSLAFLLLALTGCDDDRSSSDDPPDARSRRASGQVIRRDGAVSLAFLLLALTGCDDDGWFHDPIR